MMMGMRRTWVLILLGFLCIMPASATLIDGIMIVGEDVIATSTLGEVEPTVTAVPIDDIFLVSEDVEAYYGLTGVTVPMNSVPVDWIFLSGEDVLANYQLEGPDGPPYCPCCSLCLCCGPDFNENGHVDWGDVVKLAYYYWGLIDEDTLCGWQ